MKLFDSIFAVLLLCTTCPSSAAITHIAKISGIVTSTISPTYETIQVNDLFILEIEIDSTAVNLNPGLADSRFQIPESNWTLSVGSEMLTFQTTTALTASSGNDFEAFVEFQNLTEGTLSSGLYYYPRRFTIAFRSASPFGITDPYLTGLTTQQIADGDYSTLVGAHLDRAEFRGFAGLSEGQITSVEFSPIPEPSTMMALTAGGIGLLMQRRRKE